jgi:hypothetical protein
MYLKGFLRKEEILFSDSGNMFYIHRHFFLAFFSMCGEIVLRLDMSVSRHE